MGDLIEYKDAATGYVVRQYSKEPERSGKFYFSTESFTGDDKYFFCGFRFPEGESKANGIYRVEYATGHRELALGEEYSEFGMDYSRELAYVRKGGSVYRFDTLSGKLTELGLMPPGKNTSHFSVSKSGLVWCSFQLANKIFSLVVFDPAKGESEVVWKDDHHLGHSQACPGDDETVMYIHETGGDALQRVWMFDYPTRTVRPYYVEKEGDWITHEVWTADGNYLYFMRSPYQIMRGTRDGHNFKVMAECADKYHHCAPDRAGKWIIADRTGGMGNCAKDEVALINAETGAEEVLAKLIAWYPGAEHPHPSFNRAGNVVLFNSPLENGLSNVCAVDLEQVRKF